MKISTSISVALTLLLAISYGRCDESRVDTGSAQQKTVNDKVLSGKWDRDASWLLSRARTIISNAGRPASDGVTIWSPAGLPDFYSSSIYPRDFYYTVAACPECFVDEQLRRTVDWMLKRQAPDGRIPNSIGTNGSPWFWLYDNSQFMVGLVYLYVTHSGDDKFFLEHAKNLERAMDWLPRNPRTKLVTSEKPESMYGFQDSIALEGDELFTSVLYYQAAMRLAELYGRVDNKAAVTEWKNRANEVRQGLQSLYDEQGFFLACSRGPNRLPAVWGSALAVYAGATSEVQTKSIGNWLASNYSGYVQAGQIRHLVKPLFWSGPKYPKGVYQNGGYWATAFVWVNCAIRNVNPTLADQMLREILDDFQKYGINEVVNHELDYINRAGHGGEYCASMAPLLTLRRLGAKLEPSYKNLALGKNGGSVLTSSTIEQGRRPSHKAAHLNDGRYGNKYSWIPAASDSAPWFQIGLGRTSLVDMIIFGRDNYSSGLTKEQHGAPNRTGLSDRNLTKIEIRTSLDGVTWSEAVYSNTNFVGLKAGENAIIKLDPAVRCRFIRVDLMPSDACIDEVEVFGISLDNEHESPSTDLHHALSWLTSKCKHSIRASAQNMADGTTAFPPQVGSHYDAFWLRDYAYMLEGCPQAFSREEVIRACTLFVGAQRADGACVDCVKFDNKPVYKPGFGSMGDNPVADGSQFTVDVAWRTHQITQDRQLLESIIERLEKAMAAVPRNAKNGLVHIEAGDGWDRCPYGFTDSVHKQGDILFCSLLFVRAGRQMSELYKALDRLDDSKRWAECSQRMAEAIRTTFWNEKVGLFMAATVKCKQPDIWGSAFAVYLGVADREQALAVAKYFEKHYADIVQRGQIRHLPGGMYWEDMDRKDYYHNGGYWATATGWFVFTLDLVNSDLADQTVVDLVHDFQARGINEWVFNNTCAVPDYNASASLPLAGILKMLCRRDKKMSP